MPFVEPYDAVRGAGAGMWSMGGRGFGFRGSSPPWPYVGLGRGGLPRCGYFLSGAGAVLPVYWGAPFALELGYAIWKLRNELIKIKRVDA